MRGRGAIAVLALSVALLAPAAARAATHTYLNPTDLFGTGGALTIGPADAYPSSVEVTGLSGKVTEVTAHVLGTAGRADDMEIALTGPNGSTVMLVSDACGDTGMNGADWLIDDDAPTFLSNNGPCDTVNDGTFMPSNYLGLVEPDNMAVSGGPPPPYLNALSFLAGGPPNGTWKLWYIDDEDGFFAGIGGWALHLEVEPPPPTPPKTAPTKCKKGQTKVKGKCKKKKKKKKGKRKK